MERNVSLLRPLGYQRSRRCGYCKSTDGSCSYYLSCNNMRVEHYQELMDRGWRRSGTTYYKPDLPHSCCPHYTIRLNAKDFKPKKSQRRSVNKWNDFVIGPQYKRKAAILCPMSREHKAQTRDKFDIETAVHQSEYSYLERPKGKKSGAPVEPDHKFEVSLEPARFTQEKHSVFLRYQADIHKDPISRWGEESFKRFLCDGIKVRTAKAGNKTTKLGSYHQCYRLDGRLVAVGVLDLLPHAVSSVYLFYDPEFHDWELGKLSAMREIALTIEGQYDWYYMGYYIHSCQKMRYKGSFEPSYLLDPETLDWNALDDRLRQKLDQRKYVCPSQETDEISSKLDINATAAEVRPVAARASTASQTDTSDYDMDSDPSDAEDNDIPDGSLFDYNIPGVLKKAEVAKLDLDHWKLLIRNTLVEFEDIRGWEEQHIDDPTSIKGIVAELIAATGPRLLQNSAVTIF